MKQGHPQTITDTQQLCDSYSETANSYKLILKFVRYGVITAALLTISSLTYFAWGLLNPSGREDAKLLMSVTGTLFSGATLLVLLKKRVLYKNYLDEATRKLHEYCADTARESDGNPQSLEETMR